MPTPEPQCRYETVFSIFLVLLAFLWKDNPSLVYPQILHLFSGLLLLNLGAGMSLRRWPARRALAAGIILLNCAVITLALEYSGGPRSNLWVLYLLPIYTASLWLRTREVVWITLGAVGFNLAFQAHNVVLWDDTAAFLLALKSAILTFAAFTTHGLAERERRGMERLAADREALAALERAGQSSRKRLEQARALADVGLATASVAHDLKSPTMVVLGTAQYLLENAAFPEAFHPDIKRIIRSAQLCQQLSSSVLDGAAGRAGEVQECDVRDVVDSALAVYGDMLLKHGIAVRVDSEAGLPAVMGRPYELQRVLINLLSNAKDAMPKGGSIALRARRRVGPEGTRIELHVEDSGRGIPAEMLGRLFQPFATSKGPGKGTGIGLYMSRIIVQTHGGTLTAQNMADGGCRFALSLPALAAGLALAPAPQDGARGPA
ncbi:MAG: hypothetical protein A2X36_13610 [Elusimicrobia bacterium GWA2_69_24]|nr:MAG: hypothetical protein A2X36_13610 [Elusimicrobia bacterium GWA2_69_24]HBL19024.1 hypothetical protein [Elusimicrobiota bacterium]